MRRAVQRTVPVIASYVRVGDLVAVGGSDYRVVDLQELPGPRKKLVFDDGNVLIIRGQDSIDVTRTFSLRATPGDEARRKGWSGR